MNTLEHTITRFCEKFIKAKATCAFAGEHEALCFAVYTLLFTFKRTNYAVCIKDVTRVSVSGHRDADKTLTVYINIGAKRYTHSYAIHLFDHKASMRCYRYPYSLGMKRDRDLCMLYELLLHGHKNIH